MKYFIVAVDWNAGESVKSCMTQIWAKSKFQPAKHFFPKLKELLYASIYLPLVTLKTENIKTGLATHCILKYRDEYYKWISVRWQKDT